MRAPRVLALTDALSGRLSLRSAVPEDPNYISAGHTEHFQFSYRRSLGAAGAGIAQTLMTGCELDYAILGQWFGKNPGDLPFHVYVVDDVSGAMHFGCADTEIYVGTLPSSPPQDAAYSLLLAAEVVEVFEAAILVGWNCAYSNGEAMSRVLASELHQGVEPQYLTTAPTWLDKTPQNGIYRQDWITNTDFTDTNAFSVGCSVLFLNWLHYVRRYSWPEIIAAGGDTLSETFQRLTGAEGDAWKEFSADISKRFPPGAPSHVSSDDPFGAVSG